LLAAPSFLLGAGEEGCWGFLSLPALLLPRFCYFTKGPLVRTSIPETFFAFGGFAEMAGTLGFELPLS